MLLYEEIVDLLCAGQVPALYTSCSILLSAAFSRREALLSRRYVSEAASASICDSMGNEPPEPDELITDTSTLDSSY